MGIEEKTMNPLSTSMAAFALAAAFAAIAPPAGIAQTESPPAPSAQDHSAHHPGTAAVTGPAAPPSDAATAPSGEMRGMTAGGGQMGMMGDMKQMMSMMLHMMSADIEGRIASLRTDLRITVAQEAEWSRFADALRATAKSTDGMLEQMPPSGAAATLPARLDRHEKMLTAHLNSLKTLKEAIDPLYATLSDDQKKIADRLMIGPMGVM
jgi:LTXXQ motif family protein